MRNVNFTMEQVLNVFTQEVTTRRGKVTDTFNNARRLFCRSVLPRGKDVRPGDRLQAGLAMKATPEEICIYPYTFRLVCSNGAIAATSLEARTIANLSELEPFTIIESLQEGIQLCASEKVFTETVSKMKRSSQHQVDHVLDLLAFFTSHAGMPVDLIKPIMDRFFADTDRSQFGLANAVTAEARDTKDPQKKWDLESLGGAIAISAPSRPPKRSARARKALAVA